MQNDYNLWDKLLSEAPKRSVLMGGAPIDALVGLEPKDYDIFHEYRVGEPNVPNNWKMTNINFNDPVWVAEHNEHYLQGDNGAHKVIGSVYEYMVDGKYKVQLIGVYYKNPAEHLKNFDHSLTLARYTKRGLFIHRKVFETLDTRIIEYVGKNKSAEAKEKSLKRAMLKALKFGGGWDFKNFD